MEVKRLERKYAVMIDDFLIDLDPIFFSKMIDGKLFSSLTARYKDIMCLRGGLSNRTKTDKRCEIGKFPSRDNSPSESRAKSLRDHEKMQGGNESMGLESREDIPCRLPARTKRKSAKS